MPKLRDLAFWIEMTISVLLALGLMIWGFLARDLSEIIGIRDIFGGVFVVGFLFFIIYYVSKNKQKSVIQFYQLLPEQRKILESIIVSVILASIMIYIFNSIPFSFVSIFAFSEEGIVKVTFGLIGAIVLVVIASFVEESKLMNWLPPTITKISQDAGMNAVFALFLGILVSSVVFDLGHIAIAKKISEDFIVAAFVFSVIVRLMNIYYQAYLPALIAHLTFSMASIGTVFNLPVFVWVLPVLLVIAPFVFIGLAGGRR